jgi:hypothetical protein
MMFGHESLTWPMYAKLNIICNTPQITIIY